jgi:hypothetical protein
MGATVLEKENGSGLIRRRKIRQNEKIVTLLEEVLCCGIKNGSGSFILDLVPAPDPPSLKLGQSKKCLIYVYKIPVPLVLQGCCNFSKKKCT